MSVAGATKRLTITVTNEITGMLADPTDITVRRGLAGDDGVVIGTLIGGEVHATADTGIFTIDTLLPTGGDWVFHVETTGVAGAAEIVEEVAASKLGVRP